MDPRRNIRSCFGLINKFKKASRYEEDPSSEYSLASRVPEYDEKEILDRLESAQRHQVITNAQKDVHVIKLIRIQGLQSVFRRSKGI